MGRGKISPVPIGHDAVVCVSLSSILLACVLSVAIVALAAYGPLSDMTSLYSRASSASAPRGVPNISADASRVVRAVNGIVSSVNMTAFRHLAANPKVAAVVRRIGELGAAAPVRMHPDL